MLTIENYYNYARDLDVSVLPDPLTKGYAFVDKVTSKGQSWDAYHSSETIKKTVDTYLEKLSVFLNKGPKAHSPILKESKKRKDKSVKNDVVQKEPIRKNTITENSPEMVERIPEEIRFIKRFVNLNHRTKTKEELLRFINSLQKAIIEKRVRKTSSYAEQIMLIQQKLIETYNTMKNKILIELHPDTFYPLIEITGQQKVMASINFIKRYIGMNGKVGMKDKARKLLDQINRALDKGKISDNDPYISEIHELKKNLKAFTRQKEQKVLSIETATLNGLEGILGCACQSMNGVPSRPTVMNSLDFAKLQFDTIGLKGKWYDLIGDPSSNFTAMVFGKPKMGKSYLCIEFSGYLARHHGKVLYVAKEEGLDLTLQNKLKDTGVKHPDFFVASQLPDDLTNYDFIFLDSVSKLGLTAEDLTILKKSNPTKSFIFIFQTTKEGKFRGANTFQHDVDIVMEVPQKGKVIQMGRFNQGGQMDIFADTDLKA